MSIVNTRILTQDVIVQFERYLFKEEKSSATIGKYIRDVKLFAKFAGDKYITKELLISFKAWLIENDYAVCSVNSMLASINSLLNFMGCGDCKIKSLRQQRQIYRSEEKELTKSEYIRLLQAAKENQRLCLVMQTICSTGIRVSELLYFTVEAVLQGKINISCKNKTRQILLPGKLKKMLLNYAKKNNIEEGAIFVTVNGNPINRSLIWSQMKRLSNKAKVQSSKVFPHNLRKLFACTFYKLEKDIAKLADILGHSNINTTRIYIMSTGNEHRRKIEKLDLLLYNIT